MVFGGHLEASPLDLVIVRATKRREVLDLELHSRSKAFIRDIVAQPLRCRYNVVRISALFSRYLRRALYVISPGGNGTSCSRSCNSMCTDTGTLLTKELRSALALPRLQCLPWKHRWCLLVAFVGEAHLLRLRRLAILPYPHEAVAGRGGVDDV